jgi:hypothetical protein
LTMSAKLIKPPLCDLILMLVELFILR